MNSLTHKEAMAEFGDAFARALAVFVDCLAERGAISIKDEGGKPVTEDVVERLLNFRFVVRPERFVDGDQPGKRLEFDFGRQPGHVGILRYGEDVPVPFDIGCNRQHDFLAGTGQNNVGAGPPSYVEDYEQWDLSTSYWINDNFQVYADIINLTNETSRVYGRSELQTLFATQLGTRYNIGFRYKY